MEGSSTLSAPLTSLGMMSHTSLVPTYKPAMQKDVLSCTLSPQCTSWTLSARNTSVAAAI